MKSLGKIFDPTVRLILCAIGLSFFVPVEGRAMDFAKALSNAGIFTLFLINGIRIARGEITAGLANWRFLVPLFLWVYVVMAAAGVAISGLISPFVPPLIALGFLYLGALPTTVQSAVSYTTLSGGNAALSVVGSALVNIAGVFITAPLFAAIGGGNAVHVSGETAIRIALLLVLPFVIGQMVQGRFIGLAARQKAKIVWFDRCVISFVVYVAFSGAMKQDIWHKISVSTLALVLAAVLVWVIAAHIITWALGAKLGFNLKDRVALLFTASQKSVAIGAPLGALLFDPKILGFVLVPLLIYHLSQLMLAAFLSPFLAAKVAES